MTGEAMKRSGGHATQRLKIPPGSRSKPYPRVIGKTDAPATTRQHLPAKAHAVTHAPRGHDQLPSAGDAGRKADTPTKLAHLVALMLGSCKHRHARKHDPALQQCATTTPAIDLTGQAASLVVRRGEV